MKPCSICAAPDAAPFAVQDGFHYVSCRNCGFVFLNPMPDSETLIDIYNADSEGIDASTYPKAGSRMRRAFVRALRLAPYFTGRDAIDVGCGGGFMVEAMRRLGARASGIDISAPAIAYARNAFPAAAFYGEDFDTFRRRDRQFDFLHSSEVIEHIGDAAGYMGFLAAIARPGARLFLTTPDIAHPSVPDPVTDWDMLAPPRHVQIFSESTLTRLFDAYGFEIVKRFRKRTAPTLQVLARKH